jgi:hypothetical protein
MRVFLLCKYVTEFFQMTLLVAITAVVGKKSKFSKQTRLNKASCQCSKFT